MESIVKDQEYDDIFALDEEESNETQSAKYLLFNLGGELYGINIADVTEIIEMQKITQVPDMPDFIKGVINLRGKVIPVMDLRLRFSMTEQEYGDRTCIIISKVDDSSLGMIVDTVAEVHDILAADIEQPPGFSNNGAEVYIEAIGKVDDQVAVLIDARKILLGQEIRGVKSQIDEG